MTPQNPTEKKRELNEQDKKALGEFILTVFNVNDSVDNFQAHWSRYGFEVACDYFRSDVIVTLQEELLTAAEDKIKAQERVIAKLKEQRNYLIDNYYNQPDLPDQTVFLDQELEQLTKQEGE